MDVLLTDIDTLDMTNAEQVSSLFLQFRPDVVINTAAYTQVDKAEEAVNAYGPYLLAKECHKIGALSINCNMDEIGVVNDQF